MHHGNELDYLCLSPIAANSSVHTCTYGTRTREDFGKRGVRYKASKIWKSLPDSLKVIGTSKQFKNKLKQ